MAEDNIQNKVKQKLQDKGVSEADIAEMMSDEAQPVEEKVTDAPEDVLPKIENDSADPLIEDAGATQPYEVMAEDMSDASNEFPGYRLGLMDMEEAEITEEDKESFMECVIDGGRFKRPFKLFGGRVRGVFRSRTTEESSAVISELARRARGDANLSTLEYSSLMRHATLAFQVAELNGVDYPEIGRPYKSTYDAESNEVKPPKWWKLVERYGAMQEGTEQAIYTALMEFERVYWTMVKKAADQNFWNPGDSTSG